MKIKRVVIVSVFFVYGLFSVVTVTAGEEDEFDLPDINTSVKGDEVRIPKEDFEKMLAFVTKIRSKEPSTKKVCRGSEGVTKIEKAKKKDTEEAEYELPPKPDDVVITRKQFMSMARDIASTIVSKLPEVVDCTSV